MRYLKVLAPSALAVMMLVACGSSATQATTQPNPPASSQQESQATTQPNPPASSQQQSQGDAVTGTVTWPDGRPAANTQVYWFPGGYSVDGTGGYADSHIGADGSYSLGGCPCSQLTGYLYVPANGAGDPLNGGRDCWIILQDQGTFSGITANPGDTIDWQPRDMPCSAYPYRSDPSVVQSEDQILNPAANGGDYSVTGGSWQNAEARTSGG